MSRIGKLPIKIPQDVTVQFDGQTLMAKGPKGSQSFELTDEVTVSLDSDTIRVSPCSTSKRSRQHWGMCRTMIANCLTGVTTGFRRELQIIGVGYRANAQGNTLKLTLGFSHEVNVNMPTGIQITTPSNTRIIVEGANKQQVGQIAAQIRQWRPPEPFKGKGVRYTNEYVFRKQGKNK